MASNYEIIKTGQGIGLPLKTYIHSVNSLRMHWHKHLEILFVLEGSINITINKTDYILGESDVILINSHDTHSINKTSEDNIILGFQIDASYYDYYFSNFSKSVFYCNSTTSEAGDSIKYDYLRSKLANIVWELNKKKQGYGMKLGSEVLLLGQYLLQNFNYRVMTDEEVDELNISLNSEMRLMRILDYIDENVDKGLTLSELAEMEDLSVQYLSNYIKKSLGISFQEYLNSIRVERAAYLLLNTDKNIVDIALESGFPSSKSLNSHFKAKYKLTPSKYRTDMGEKYLRSYKLTADKDKIKSKSYFDVDRTNALEKLWKYLEIGSREEEKIYFINKEVYLDFNKKSIMKNDYYWARLTTFGRAKEGLSKNVQDQIREAQREIGFKYIRFHGIFSDDMMVYNLASDGRVTYNWTYVDELFDFFKSVNIRPFVELSFMPSEIRSTDQSVFWWKANISGPKDMNLWTDMIKNFLIHCINRYGRAEVENWYFEVWNEPELENIFWVGGKEKYFELYRATVETIKVISPKIKVGGPAVTYQGAIEDNWIEDFLVYCKREAIALDFLSYHIYSESFGSIEEVLDASKNIKNLEELNEAIGNSQANVGIYFGKDHTENVIGGIEDLIAKNYKKPLEVHVTEWNASAFNRNLIHDTCYVATFLVRNILKNMGRVDSLGYWTITDAMEEFKLGIEHFHGNFGLINKDGIKKASYFAYYLLGKLGDEVLDIGENYIITRQGEDLQILAYNYTHFDDFFISGDISLLDKIHRYDIYEDDSVEILKFNIKDISGSYKLMEYDLNRKHGSAFDNWVSLGAIEEMTEDEIAYLKDISRPSLNIAKLKIENKYEKTVEILPHGVKLILLNKEY